MKKLPLMCLLVVAAPVLAKEVHEVREVDPKAEISIFNTAGEVKVTGWSRQQVAVDADLGSGVKELIFETDGRQVTIKVKAPRHSSRNISSDLNIRVPEGSSLEISTVSADVEVSDLRGWQQLETVSGDIETALFAADVEIESVSGDIEARGDNKKMRTRASSVSGNLELQGLDGELEVETVSGDIVLGDSRFESAEMKTVNGELVYHAGLYGDSRLEAETVNGEVDIKFAGKVSARFDIETFNGEIRNCFGPKPERTSKYAPGLELKFSEGEGDGRVSVETLNGDLRLCRD